MAIMSLRCTFIPTPLLHGGLTRNYFIACEMRILVNQGNFGWLKPVLWPRVRGVVFGVFGKLSDFAKSKSV